MNKHNNFVSFSKKISSSNWKHGNRVLYFSIFVCFSIFYFYHYSHGYVVSSDSESYSEWADILIELNFNFYKYFSQNTFINPNYIYTIPVLLIALLKILFEIKWQFAFMNLNLLLLFLSLILLSKSLSLLKVRPLIISFVMPMLLLSVDLLIWPRYILTDTIFSFLVLLIIYVTIKGIVYRKFNYFNLLFSIALIYLTRPTSLPFIFSIIAFIGLTKIKYNFSKKFILISIFFLIMFIPILYSSIFEFMNTFLSEKPQALFLIEMVEKGMIIHDRPETWVEAPNSFFDVAILYLIRFFYFFNPYAESFSTIHVILNYFQALLILFSIFLLFFLKSNTKAIKKSVALILMISISVAFFHSFTLIDYDWRYRFPIIIPLIMILPMSLEILLRNINKNVN